VRGNCHGEAGVCEALRFKRAALLLSLAFHAARTEYKVEARAYYSKVTTNKNHIVETSSEEIQELLDRYTADGWHLASTDATSYGFAVYVYLYFERDTASD